MRSWMIVRSAGFVLFLWSIPTGCTRSLDPTPGDAQSASAAIGRHPQSRDERERLVRSMIDAAVTSPKMETRVAALLAASDVQTLAPTLRAIDEAIGVVMDNVKNADTVGYKGSTARVQGETASIMLDMTQGSLENTGSPLDLAIIGEGFFAVWQTDSRTIAYTRAGTFTTNANGEFLLAVGQGYKLEPPIVLPVNATNITVGTDGVVTYVKAGATVKSTAGQIKLVYFPNARALSKIGGGMYAATRESGDPATLVPGTSRMGQILSGFLESSNVDLTHEYIRLRFLTEWREMIHAAVLGTGTKEHVVPATQPDLR